MGRELCSQPHAVGWAPLSTALKYCLPGSESIQRVIVSCLCALCGGGADDAAAARSLANALLLSGLSRLPLTQRQLITIQRASTLSQTQRAKLVALFRGPE